MDRGWTRGHVTGCLSEFPPGAPGYLELGPLMLAAVQEMDAGTGYPLHHHEAVETITIILSGELAHNDSVGGADFTGTDDVAVVSAGRGIDHEEFARGAAPRAVLFWVRSTLEHAPRFEKRTFPRAERRDRLVTVAAASAEKHIVPLRTDVIVRTGVLSAGAGVTHETRGRGCYVLSTDAAFEINGARAEAGDRVLVTGVGRLDMRALGATELVLVDC